MNLARRKILEMPYGGLLTLALALLVNAGAVLAAPSDSAVIHLTKSQEKSLNIKTVLLKTALVRPAMTLYGELKQNPDGVFMLSSPLAGVVLTMPGKHWPQIGDVVIRGASVAGIKPVVSTSLQITLALELTKIKADFAAAKVAELTAEAAYQREKSLYAHNKAVSLQRVQTSQAAFADAHARVRADAQSISAIARQLKTKVGGFLPLPVFQSGMVTEVFAHTGEAVAANQPLLKIENFHTLVAAVALPASDFGSVAMAAVIRVRALGHKRWLKATPLTLGPRADRQTRGLSMLYLIKNSGTLRPGMALTAQVSKAVKPVPMTFIPRAAVIWWRGERWVYAARGSGVFALCELIHPMALPGGFGVREGTVRSRNIVSNGAQLLLTIQFQGLLKPSF